MTIDVFPPEGAIIPASLPTAILPSACALSGPCGTVRDDHRAHVGLLMGGDEAQGFIIRDRRGHAESGEPSQGEGTESPPSAEAGPPLSFSSFVFSLSTSALMLMGERLDPKQASVPMNLSQAKEIIDILSILDEKTRGNLTSDEGAVLRDMLYALRMKYVDVASGRQATPPS